MLGGEDGGQAGNIMEVGVPGILQLSLRLVGQLSRPQLVVIESELE